MQVQKLSDGDAEETTRLLYNRNVSSSKLLDDRGSEPLPEPKRVAGDIISFKRCCCLPLHNLMFTWKPACRLAPTSMSDIHSSRDFAGCKTHLRGDMIADTGQCSWDAKHT